MRHKPGCKICGQPLKDEKELGPDCQKRFDNTLAAIGTTSTEIGDLFLLNDPTVDSWLRKMRNAIYELLRPGAKDADHLQWANYNLRNARQRAERVVRERAERLADETIAA
jgi:hypothetical protein